jgi:hypothetical protein
VAVCAPLIFRTIGQLALERDTATRLAEKLAAARETAASAQCQVVPAASVATPTSLHRLGAGLPRLRRELGIHQRRLSAAATSGTLWSSPKQLPSDEQWRAARDTVSTGALADAGHCAVLADAYVQTARVARGNALRLLAGLPGTATLASVSATRWPP